MPPADTISYRPLLEWALYPCIQLLVSIVKALEESRVVAAIFQSPYAGHAVYRALQIGLYFLAAYLPAKLVFVTVGLARRRPPASRRR